MRGALLAQFGLAHFEMENKVQSAVESEPLSVLERAFPWLNREIELSRIKSIISHFHIQYKFKRHNPKLEFIVIPYIWQHLLLFGS